MPAAASLSPAISRSMQQRPCCASERVTARRKVALPWFCRKAVPARPFPARGLEGHEVLDRLAHRARVSGAHERYRAALLQPAAQAAQLLGLLAARRGVGTGAQDGALVRGETADGASGRLGDVTHHARGRAVLGHQRQEDAARARLYGHPVQEGPDGALAMGGVDERGPQRELLVPPPEELELAHAEPRHHHGEDADQPAVARDAAVADEGEDRPRRVAQVADGGQSEIGVVEDVAVERPVEQRAPGLRLVASLQDAAHLHHDR